MSAGVAAIEVAPLHAGRGSLPRAAGRAATISGLLSGAALQQGRRRRRRVVQERQLERWLSRAESSRRPARSSASSAARVALSRMNSVRVLPVALAARSIRSRLCRGTRRLIVGAPCREAVAVISAPLHLRLHRMERVFTLSIQIGPAALRLARSCAGTKASRSVRSSSVPSSSRQGSPSQSARCREPGGASQRFGPQTLLALTAARPGGALTSSTRPIVLPSSTKVLPVIRLRMPSNGPV